MPMNATTWLQAGLPAWHSQASRCGHLGKLGSSSQGQVGWRRHQQSTHMEYRSPVPTSTWQSEAAAAPQGWLCPPASGPTLPACAVLTPLAGCSDGRTDPQATKGGYGEAMWGSDLASRLGPSRQVLPCRPALELEALVWVSQWQDPPWRGGQSRVTRLRGYQEPRHLWLLVVGRCWSGLDPDQLAADGTLILGGEERGEGTWFAITDEARAPESGSLSAGPCL